MPMYDLRCPHCGLEFDDLVSSREAVTEISCEACGTVGMELKPSLFASSSAGGGSYSGVHSCGSGGFT